MSESNLRIFLSSVSVRCTDRDMSHRQIVFNGAPMMPSSSNIHHITSEAILQDVIIWIYVGVIVVIGLILNLIMFGALLKGKCNGKIFFFFEL